MKQLYYFFFAFFWWSMCIAQDYVPLQITSGFNEDVIAENHPASTHTTTSVDATNSNANNALMSINYPKATVGLPANGLIASIASATPGLTFQLAPYNQNNTLIINATNGTGTLAVQTTEKLITLYILATSGSSPSTFTGTITFTDETTQTFDSQIVPDWYDQGTPAIAIRGIGRVPRTGTEDPDNNTTNPKLFQVAIDISSANQNKIIKQVDFTKTSSTSGFLNILALSGEITPTCFKPTNLGVQNMTATSVDLTWTSAGNTFDIKWGKRDFNVTTAGTLVTSFANNGTLSGLIADTNYDYYVRRDCGTVDGVSAWAGPFRFRTGYCIPIGARNNGDEIRNFKLSNLNNNSNASEGTAGYMDYSGTVGPAILEIGQAYVASLTSGTGTENHGAAIWIDYNNNLVFEANEKVSAIGNTISPNTTANFPNFAIPATVKPGLYRLRVQYHYNKAGADLDPCRLTSEYGETEDYAVQIMSGSGCFPPLNTETPGITKNSVDIVWDAPIQGTSPVSGYEYEVRTSGLPGSGSTGLVASNTTGAGVLNTSVTGLQPSTTYQLYVRANCGLGSFSEWTAAHELKTLCDSPIISATGGTSCGAGTTTLEATSDKGVLTWFETETSIAALGTGTTFITPKILNTTSFWVSATEELASGSSGKEKIGVYLYDSTISNRSIIFNVAEEIILESTDIYTNHKGTNIEIQIIDSLGKEIYSTGVITLNHTGVTTPNVVPLHAILKPGKGYQIKMKSMTNGILRDRDTSINFPYLDSNGLLEVIASIDSEGQLSLHDYFYFYNLKYKQSCTSPRTEVIATVTDVPTFTLSETELVLCKGASSSAVTIASGAVSNADYTWLPATGVSGDAQKGWVFNPSVSTTYQLTASVNGCEAIQEVVVQVIDLTLTSSQTNIKCQGASTGTATVDVSGGTPPYTYAWDTNPMQTDKTAMNLTAGTYNVIITDKNGCTIDQKFIITEPTALSITSEQTDVSCNGGSNGTATVSVSGGTGGYTYSWSPSGGTGATASELTAGTYTVTVTDANSCTATASVIITEPNEVEKPKVSTPLVYNYGDVAQPLTAEANTGNTLLWYTTATGATGSGNALIPSTYTIGIQEYWVSQVTAVGCESARELITVEITPAPLTVTAHPQTKIYGEADPALTYDVVGLKKGETAATVLTGSLVRDAGETVGAYTIRQGDLTANGNYDITYVNKDLTITPAPLTVTAHPQTKIYGEADPALTYDVVGLKKGETAAIVLTGSLVRDAGEAVGVYTIRQGDLTANANYNLIYESKDLTITPAPLTVTAHPQTKIYGETDPALTYDVVGLKKGETVATVLTGSLVRDAGEIVGAYTIRQGDLTANANYDITYVNKDLIITPTPLTVTAHPQTKIYGEADPALTYDVVGLKKGETPATVLTGSLVRDAGENTGVYTIQQGNLQANSNYVLTYKKGELQISPAPLQITPQKGQTKVYGQKDTVLQYTAKGLKFADTVAVLSGELGRQQGEQVGVYIYTQGTLSTVNNNYKIAVVAGEQYTITPAPLTVKANANQSKVYGTKDPVFTYQIIGMQFSESAYYAVTGALSRKQGEDVGLYAIEQGSLIARANYVITSFVSADFEIKKAKIEGLRLPSETFVYDGQPKSLKVVGDMPSDAVVTYTNNGQINVGKYAVFATVDYGKNYEVLKLNGELFIEQATQEITFAPISKVVLEDTPTLQLTAKASSNLPITYTIDSQEPANVATIDSKTGVLTFLQPGQVVVTAHQEGNVNYKAAKPVSQTVEITSRDASIWDLLVDGVSYGKVGTEVYVSIGCDKPQDVVVIEVKTQYGAVVVPSALIEVNVKEYGIHQQLITVTSMDGTVSKSYKVIIEKRIPTEHIIFQKYDNILLVNKNTSTNGGYVFTGYQWYKNGEVIGKKQTYSAGGEVGAILESGAEYHVELTLYDGRKIVSCPIVVAAKAKAGLVVYPNPVNKSIHTQVNIRSQRKITQGVYTVYTLLGQRIAHEELYGENMSITLPNTIASGSYFLVLKGEDVSETVQFIVKE